jgi:hypothetical protein
MSEDSLSEAPRGVVGLEALEQAYRSVLSESFEDQMRALALAAPWYSEALPIEEVFRLWLKDSIDLEESASWIFSPVRASERRLICDALGIERNEIVGKSSAEAARVVAERCGLAFEVGKDVATIVRWWHEIVDTIEAGDDERASVRLRSAAERLLKRTIFFHVAGGLEVAVSSVVRNPAKLRLPARLQNLDGCADAVVSERVQLALSADSAVDMGFLILFLRKVSAFVERTSSRSYLFDGEFFSTTDQEAFTTLAKALQAYTHDKPTMAASRRADLLEGAKAVAVQVLSMARRRVIPEEGVVVEVGRSYLGSFVCLHTRKGKMVRSVRSTPPIFGRVLFVSMTDRDYAMCDWILNPWPAD